MKKMTIKKLVLNKRTIADLGKKTMTGVRAGGVAPPTGHGCVIGATGTACTCVLTCDQAGKTIPESICTC